MSSLALALPKQTQLSERVWNSVIAVVYLIGIAALHTTIPAIFSVQVSNVTVDSMVSVQKVPTEFDEYLDTINNNRMPRGYDDQVNRYKGILASKDPIDNGFAPEMLTLQKNQCIYSKKG
jgi:hypothetical protein